MKPSYRTTLITSASAEEIFAALTLRIPEWWSEDFTGAAEKASETFTIRFGSTHKTMLIEEAIPNQKVVWRNLEAFINSPALSDKSEWVNTRMIWEILAGDEQTLSFTHEGLTTDFECYDICEKGWEFFIHKSLGSLLNENKGMPYKVQLAKEA